MATLGLGVAADISQDRSPAGMSTFDDSTAGIVACQNSGTTAQDPIADMLTQLRNPVKATAEDFSFNWAKIED